MTSSNRWNLDRLLVCVAGTACALIVVHLRDRYDWEETDAELDAELALVAACGAAGVFAGMVGLVWRRRVAVAIRYAVFAAALVIAVIFVYYVIRLFTTADYS
jgi:hypothetical protein